MVNSFSSTDPVKPIELRLQHLEPICRAQDALAAVGSQHGIGFDLDELRFQENPLLVEGHLASLRGAQLLLGAVEELQVQALKLR